MDRLVDVAGRARLVLLDPPPSVARAVAARLDPYPLVPTTRATVAAGAPDVILEAVPGDEPRRPFLDVLGDTGDGIVTAWDGASLHLLAGDSSCELPRIGEPGPLRFRYGPGFPVWSILGPVLGPVLHGAIRERDGVVVHASAVEVDGEAVVIAGWSESGKTETALALAVAGAPLLTDKWTVVAPGRGPGDAEVLPFPAPLSIRRWLVDALPDLQAALPASARLQFVGAATAAWATARVGLRGRAGRGPAEGLLFGALDRALALGERTSLSMARLRALGFAADAPTRERRLRAVVLLTALPDGQDDDAGPVRSTRADARWAARRLARSAEAERSTWNDLVGRIAYAAERRADDEPRDPASDPGRAELWQPPAVRIAEEERLAWLLDGIPIIEVTAPFPGDPRRVAETVRRAVSEVDRSSVDRPPSGVEVSPPAVGAMTTFAPPPAAASPSTRPQRIGEVA